MCAARVAASRSVAALGRQAFAGQLRGQRLRGLGAAPQTSMRCSPGRSAAWARASQAPGARCRPAAACARRRAPGGAPPAPRWPPCGAGSAPRRRAAPAAAPLARSSSSTVACTVAGAARHHGDQLDDRCVRVLQAGISSSVSDADSAMRMAQRHLGTGDEGGFQRLRPGRPRAARHAPRRLNRLAAWRAV